jgi:hypothetical protein
MEFLYMWYPCAPSLHEGRYELVFDEELWSEVPVADLGPQDTRPGRLAPLKREGALGGILGQKAHVDRYAAAHGVLQQMVGPAQGLCVASFSIEDAWRSLERTRSRTSGPRSSTSGAPRTR